MDCIIDYGTVQCRDLASAMRTALTTRGLADCASLILKTVSLTMHLYTARSVDICLSTGTLPSVY